MEVSNKIVPKHITGDQSNDPGKTASASPSTPSPDNRNQQTQQATTVSSASSLDLWPDSQQVAVPNTKGPTTANKMSGQSSKAQYDLTLMKLEFSKDSQTGKIVVKIIDQNTDKVIRQVPPQEFLNIVHNMNKVAQELLKRLPKTI
ncbi:MAG TPA: flagellar protein FlaG [Balneolales bacterium]|nr:flagellar protein FlaG [Balneolales bacterium]